ncbi:MAG: hypothetical protein IJJ33_14855, partial [Victivallales bacterium]|nr:hypothetical protein [Victivallales bacterium]
EEGAVPASAALNSNVPKLHAAKAICCFRYWEFWSLGDEMGEMREMRVPMVGTPPLSLAFHWSVA